ncbi:unnamed protein product [Owenia fusiformis]|uniref:Uncharacterized protein n=1 Tax=Owenia fusiformis TaxID=6347 RepID=A0A8J1Y650_OWEFU|nr:unnamed protein product [Owenia fusiformis]
MFQRKGSTADTIFMSINTPKMYTIKRKISRWFHPVCVRLITISTICAFILITFQYKELIHILRKDPNNPNPNVRIDDPLEKQGIIGRKYNNPELQDTFKTIENSTDSFVQSDDANIRVKKRPGVINIGIQKCGTGALLSYLNIHPNLKIKWSEVHFFDKLINHDHPFEEEVKRYIQMLPKAFPNETILEKTPAYFDLADPYDLYRMNPALKIILLVCDPVRRVISAYLHNKLLRVFSKAKSYEEIIFDKNGYVNTTEDIITRSRYDKPLERYLKYFPRNQFLIMENTFLLNQPALAMQDIEQFLGLKTFYTNETFYFNTSVGYHCINPSIQPKRSGCMLSIKYKVHPYVSEENVLKLKRYFQPINDNFMKLAGKNFPSLTYF